MIDFLKNCFVPVFFAMAIATFAYAQLPEDAALDASLHAVSKKPMILDTLAIKDMDINDVLKLLSAKSGLNIIAGKSITGRVTIFLQNVEVHDALTIILSSNDLAYMESRGVVQIMTNVDYEQATGHKFGVNCETKVFNINYAKADELAKTVGQMLTKDIGSIEFDARSSTLVVTDVPSKIDQIEVMINAMDRMEKEVFIEAKIFQVALGDEYQMGVNWEKLILKTNNTGVGLSSSFPISGSLTTGVGAMSIGTLSSGSFSQVVQALDSFGKSRILSSPRLAVINNQEANILIGTTTPYTTSTTTSTTSSPVTAESVSFIDTGVKLHVTPVIHDDGFITMKIKPEISNVEAKPYTDANGNSIPIVDTSEVQTTVRVKDGVTIIIGGLMKNELINNKNKIPVLGDIPFLGKAFGNETRNMQKTEIVIFLTPHIINGDVHADPDSYIDSTPTLKGDKVYYDPLPKDRSTVPVP